MHLLGAIHASRAFKRAIAPKPCAAPRTRSLRPNRS